MSNARQIIIELGEQLADEDNTAFNLWTWLPSYKAAQAAHGDYASEHTPDPADVMREAAQFNSHGLAPTPEQIREAGDLYQCPCGEEH